MKGVRRIPVMDEAGWRAGIISWDDLLAHWPNKSATFTGFFSAAVERERR
jgi:hypothetical protein